MGMSNATPKTPTGDATHETLYADAVDLSEELACAVELVTCVQAELADFQDSIRSAPLRVMLKSLAKAVVRLEALNGKADDLVADAECLLNEAASEDESAVQP